MLTVIQTIACAYQQQRKRDSKGRVIAEIQDYWMAYQVVQEAFRENMGAQDKKTEKYLEAIRGKEKLTPGNLAKMFGVSGAAVSSWVGKRIRTGMIEWVDETGYHFIDDKALETAKRKGIAYLKISDTYQNETVKGLPTPFDLTGDPRWNEGGDLLQLYDLELEKRTALSTVFTGVNPVFIPILNTVKEDEMVNIIEYSGDEPDGVKVLSQNTGGEGNNLKAGDGGLKIPLSEPVEDDFRKIQGGNGQGKSDCHPLDEFWKGCEGSLF
jgi:DNA-binding transcriptional regulator YiaG